MCVHDERSLYPRLPVVLLHLLSENAQDAMSAYVYVHCFCGGSAVHKCTVYGPLWFVGRASFAQLKRFERIDPDTGARCAACGFLVLP